MPFTARAFRRASLILVALYQRSGPWLVARTPPQDILPVITLRIGESTVEAEVADEVDERTIGLMGREKLPDGQGMLFVFREPQAMNFWMRATLVPLSIGYINAAGILR